MSRSFSSAGHAPKFKEISDKLQLQFCGELKYKEYFYDDGYTFKMFKDKDGNVYEEFEAACPWASGPVLFLGLKLQKDKSIICTWTAQEINEDMGVECCTQEDLDSIGKDNE